MPLSPTLRLSAIPLILGICSATLFAQPPAKRHPTPKPPQPTQPTPAPGTPASSTPQATPLPTTPNTPTVTNPGPVELSDEPFRLEKVGLTLRLPVGTGVQSSIVGGRIVAQVLPKTAARTWMMNIETPETANPNASLKEAADKTLALLQGSVGVVDPAQKNILETDAKLLERTDSLNLPGGPCARLYVSLPAQPGDSGRVVKGYTIFKPSSTQFVVFELVTPEGAFAQSRGIYETTVATAKFQDPVELLAARGAAVETGIQFVAKLTPADYDAACDGVERWYRLSRPAASGNPNDADEMGYRGVTFWRGRRGELDGTRADGKWNRADNQEGYLVRFRIRLLDGASVIDSDAVYFMSTDRAEEAWSVRTTKRELKPSALSPGGGAGAVVGKTLGTWTEIGARDRDKMEVSGSGMDGKPKRTRPFVQLKGYLCQVESFMLPQLLIRKGVSTEFGFYTYRSATENISLRRDTLARDPANGGAWLLKTEYREDASPQASLYKDNGELIRSDLGDGRLWKPIELRELLELWKSKGLPVGAGK